MSVLWAWTINCRLRILNNFHASWAVSCYINFWLMHTMCWFLLCLWTLHLWNVNYFILRAMLEPAGSEQWTWYSRGEGALHMASNLNSAAWESWIVKARKDSSRGAEGTCGNFLRLSVSVAYWVRSYLVLCLSLTNVFLWRNGCTICGFFSIVIKDVQKLIFFKKKKNISF